MSSDGSGEDPAVLIALAAEVNGRVEFRSYIQDTEGRWYWSEGLMPRGRGTWNADLYDDQVRVEGRIVSDWQPIDRDRIAPSEAGS